MEPFPLGGTRGVQLTRSPVRTGWRLRTGWQGEPASFGSVTGDPAKGEERSQWERKADDALDGCIHQFTSDLCFSLENRHSKGFHSLQTVFSLFLSGAWARRVNQKANTKISSWRLALSAVHGQEFRSTFRLIDLVDLVSNILSKNSSLVRLTKTLKNTLNRYESMVHTESIEFFPCLRFFFARERPVRG